MTFHLCHLNLSFLNFDLISHVQNNAKCLTPIQLLLMLLIILHAVIYNPAGAVNSTLLQAATEN